MEVASGDHEVSLPAGTGRTHGTLTRPAAARGLILFAHGSGSSRFSPRNRFVAGLLQKAGFATLLMDLLTEEEDEFDQLSGEYRFDIELLARRLIEVTGWVRSQPELASLPLGYFGASTGAASALVAAAELPGTVSAVVSRGGRPDLAGDSLGRVQIPVLLIVGGEDDEVIELNREARRQLAGPVKHLKVIPGAGHLFEEPGSLREVARLAIDFFESHLVTARIESAIDRPSPEI